MFTKGKKVLYTSGLGFLYSAVVQRAHKNGEYTVQLYFPYRNGTETQGCFQGDKFRVGLRHLAPFPG